MKDKEVGEEEKLEPELPPLPPPTIPEPPVGDEEWKRQMAERAKEKMKKQLHEPSVLRKLHLQHYHMPLSQFKKRTSHMNLPSTVYTLFDIIVKQCEYCNKQKPPPARSRVSGLRATKFGELIFLDHGVVKVGEKTYCFLLILDAATTFVAAYPVQTVQAEETIQ